MSGGVDSSVAAYLLQKQGFDVIGATIKTWSNDECRDEKSKGCCSIRDIEDARSVARKLGIPYYVLDLSADFKEKVMDTFIEEYVAGRTPNPCIECNRHIKFGVLMNKAKELEASFVATGHYARKDFDAAEDRFYIREGRDATKDQSYVLFGLTQEQLAKTLFPVGELAKSEVRAMAQELGMRVFDKPDSQEICFVRTNYTEFVAKAAPDKMPGAGNFVAADGRVMGQHGGIHRFTIGQRKRIQITDKMPYYVTRIVPETNEVIIGREADLMKDTMSVRNVNWILKPRLGAVKTKIRHQFKKTDSQITRIENGRAQIKFTVPQKAVTPGQAAVFYDGDRVLGGGWIE